MNPRSCIAASARADGANVPSLLAGSASYLVNSIGQVMIGELYEEVQAELNLFQKAVNELRISVRKVLDHASVGSDSIKNNALSDEMNLKFPELATA